MVICVDPLLALVETAKGAEVESNSMLSQAESDVLVAEQDAVLAVDMEGIVVFANAGALRLLGHNTLLGQPLETIVPERFRSAHHAGFARYRDTGHSRLKGHTIRVPALCADGSEQEVDLTLRFFERPDKTLLAVAALRRERGDTPPEGLVRIETVLRGREYRSLP